MPDRNPTQFNLTLLPSNSVMLQGMNHSHGGGQKRSFYFKESDLWLISTDVADGCGCSFVGMGVHVIAHWK